MTWQLNLQAQTAPDTHKSFESIESTFALIGQQITRDPISEVVKVEREQIHYYVKRYYQAGKHLRRYLGRSRIKNEWHNLLFFKSLGINTAKIIAYGEQRQWGMFSRGALVTEELRDTFDLKTLAQEASPLLSNADWIEQISQQVANFTRLLHQHHFVHNDLKWRNILVTLNDKPQVFFIDCPLGSFWPTIFLKPFLNYRIIKDLACLDKVAKHELSKSQRLSFYKNYSQCQHLEAKHKKQIRKILNFFNNRE